MPASAFGSFLRFEYGSPHMLAVVFVVNALGEAGVPFPLVMQGLLFFAGYELVTGNTAGAAALVLTALWGSGTGATVLYWFSRLLGTKALSRYGRFIPIKQQWLARAQARVSSANPVAIALGRLTPGMMVPTSLVSGMAKLPWPRFLTGVGLSELAWIVPIVSLGVVAGYTTGNLEPLVRIYPRFAVGAFVAMALFLLARALWRRRHPARQPVPSGERSE